MAVSNLLKFVIHWTGYGEEGTISYWYSGGGGGYAPEALSAAAGAAVTAAQGNETPSSWSQLCSHLSAQQKIDLVSLYLYADPTQPATALGTATPSNSAGTGVSRMGLQNSVCATLLTARAGASFRGRQYFPGHCQVVDDTTAQLSNTTVIPAYATMAANLANDFKGALMTSLSEPTLLWCVYSRTKALTTEITQVRVDTKLDTQRRREKSMKPTGSTLVSA